MSGNDGSGGRASSGQGGPSAGATSAVGTSGNVVLSSTAGNGQGGEEPDPVCLADSREGTRPETSLYFLVDVSDSMHCPVPEFSMCDSNSADFGFPNRWEATRTAIEAFFDAPESAGLWSGFSFFPHILGTGADCDADHYTVPTEEMAQLPGAAAQLKERLDGLVLDGSTPTKPALEGALSYAREWTTQRGLPVAVVLATDGYPHVCEEENNTIEGTAEVARAAYLATPSIPTYVLGIGSGLDELDQIAEAGGTNRAVLADTSVNDVTSQLVDVLGGIRDEVFLNCTYTIPEPPDGQTLDFGLVNVRYTTALGEEISILEDPSEGACREGWQYTADHTQIQLCGDACETVKTDFGGRLDVLFGCETQIAVPK